MTSPVLTEDELGGLVVVCQQLSKHLRLRNVAGERQSSLVALRSMVAQIHGRGLAVERCESLLQHGTRFYSAHKWRWEGADNIHRAMLADVAAILEHVRERQAWLLAGGPPL